MIDEIDQLRACDRAHPLDDDARERITATMRVAYAEARERRVTPASGAADVEVEVEVEMTPHVSEPPRRRWMLAAVASLVVVLGVGITVVQSRRSEAPSDLASSATEVDLPRSRLPGPGSLVQAGRYETALLGTPVEFTLGSALVNAYSDASVVHLTEDTFGTDDAMFGPTTGRGVTLWRLGGWNTRAESVDPDDLDAGSLPPNDVDAWIAENDVTVGADRTTRIDGHSTRVLDLRIDPDSEQTTSAGECGGSPRCFWYASVPTVSNDPGRSTSRSVPPLVSSATYRMWLVELDDLEPIQIASWAPLSDEEWHDRIGGTLIESLRIGEPAPPIKVARGSSFVIGD
jgi:hypothetical protein